MLLRVQLVSAAPTAAVPVGNFVKKFDYDQQLSFLPNLFLIPSHDGTRFMSIFFHYLSYQTVLGQWQKWAFNPRDLSTSTHKSTLPKKSPSIPFNGALITLCPSNPSDSFFIREELRFSVGKLKLTLISINCKWLMKIKTIYTIKKDLELVMAQFLVYMAFFGCKMNGIRKWMGWQLASFMQGCWDCRAKRRS